MFRYVLITAFFLFSYSLLSSFRAGGSLPETIWFHFLFIGNRYGCYSVSYTHLDVYKRQGLYFFVYNPFPWAFIWKPHLILPIKVAIPKVKIKSKVSFCILEHKKTSYPPSFWRTRGFSAKFPSTFFQGHARCWVLSLHIFWKTGSGSVHYDSQPYRQFQVF